MPGRVKQHLVDAPAGAVELLQFRAVPVRLARQCIRPGAAQLFAQRIEFLQRRAAAFAQQRLDQGRIAGEQIDVLEWRRLVENFMRVKGIHGYLHRDLLSWRLAAAGTALIACQPD